MTMIWANSADSHLLEPGDLWTERLPSRLAERAPHSVKTEKYEIITVDGEQLGRQLNDFMEAIRPPGATNIAIRLKDLDKEGVWGQVAFPSMGFWSVNIKDGELARAVAGGYNDWAYDEVIAKTARVLPAALLPLVDLTDAVRELERAAERGFQIAFLPTGTPAGREYANDEWERLWTAAERASIVLGFHIGTGADNVVYRGPGAAVVNYVETTYNGMRVLTHMVAGGALDRHPDLKIFIAEGGAGWVPALGDRMDEAYRQHKMFVRPQLSRLPGDIVRSQVYVSFQHDPTGVEVVEGMGYRNVMWGDDYPHLEGTYGHTQATLRGLFEGVADATRERVTQGAFEELFTVPSRIS